MPYLGYLLAQAVKAGQTVASAITSATNYVTRVGSSVVELSASAEVLKSPSNGSAYFNGSSNYIISPAVLTPSAGSVCYWYSTNADGANLYDMVSSGASVDDFRMILDGVHGFYTGAEYRVAFGSYANDFSWNYIMLTWDSSGSKIYHNGNYQGQNTNAPANWASTPNNTYIGARYTTGNKYVGYMCNVAIWSRALSAEEVRSVMMKSYDDLSASETKGLVSWYALDDISGTTVPDSHGNFNGTAY
jgi:hypothetical protein